MAYAPATERSQACDCLFGNEMIRGSETARRCPAMELDF